MLFEEQMRRVGIVGVLLLILGLVPRIGRALAVFERLEPAV
jgi:hypothetical protein